MSTDFRGDPASALLEVLDPEQNHSFNDHYLDLDYDLSKVMFITTANQLDTIPPALLDRMEILRLSGYIAQEKLHIAKRYLVPKQRKDHGLKSGQLHFSDRAILRIIEGYAREAGVRNLENQIKRICRKVASLVVKEGPHTKVGVNPRKILEFLKNPIFEEDELMGQGVPGVVTGLAWTSMGGSVLPIEATWVPSKAIGFKQTGQLGKVMVESSEIAYTFANANAERFGGKPGWFPAGATPKDGPSAGVTMATALFSLLLNTAVVSKLAMTGELSLTGEVLPIGGLKEKMIAANRAGVTQVVIPFQNKKDYLELEEHIKEPIQVHFARTYKEVFKVAFPGLKVKKN